MKILVTGASGFLGSHIVEELTKQGLPLKAAYRPGETFNGDGSDVMIDGLDLESFPLDITNRNAVYQAVQGCQMLFHSDFLCSFSGKDKARLEAINHLGTKNVMEAALHHGVEKVVYTSGMETLAPAPGREQVDESDGVSLDDLKTEFERSRFLAEREVTRLKQQGLPVIIVHPTVCLGTRDRIPTSLFGSYLLRYLRKKTHFYIDTGINLVDVVDVAKGHLLAAKRGQVGARYILGNQNVYMLELLRNLQKITGVKAPATALPLALAKTGNLLARTLLFKKDGVPNAVLNRLKQPLFFNPSLARNELGLPQSNVWEALRRHVIYLKNLHQI
ncbi:MAG: NAD-dependent epimerase/dehydratase family protein [Deltaproteobacteria bacterium]|nr:NAD-dependent epimerase/dehydratase family protein [Deltaproteobacteria bacterium]